MFGIGFDGQVGEWLPVGNAVTQFGQVRLSNVFPAVLKFFHHAPAALGEAGVADFAAKGQDLPPRCGDGLCHLRRSLFGRALVSLAVVVGADVEKSVVFAVVPTNQAVGCLREGRWKRLAAACGRPLDHLGQQPTAGDDRVGFEQFKAGGGAHLAGNDTLQVVFDWKFVDGDDFSLADDEAKAALESLCLLALPVEVDADGYAIEREGRVGRLWLEDKFVIGLPVPQDISFGKRGLVAADSLQSIDGKNMVERKTDGLA